MGWPANMVNLLVDARFLEIAVSSGLSAGNSLPSAPGSINELTNKKQSKGNHNRNENGKRIGCENRSVLRKKKILEMKYSSITDSPTFPSSVQKKNGRSE